MGKENRIIDILNTTKIENDGKRRWIYKLEVYYSKGGQNYFSGNVERRGYYASAFPEYREQHTSHDGRVYESTGFIIGGKLRGCKVFIEETKRFSEKRLDALAGSSLPFLSKAIKQAMAGCGAELQVADEDQEKLRKYLEAPDPEVKPAAPPKDETPDTIKAIIQQMGGRGLTGGFVYCGAKDFVYKCPSKHGECRPSYPSRETDEGLLDYEVGLAFSVNGKRGEGWKMVIAYEPDDTYTVWLWCREPNFGNESTGRFGNVIDKRTDVYCDDLKTVVERMYDLAIRERNRGFINV